MEKNIQVAIPEPITPDLLYDLERRKSFTRPELESLLKEVTSNLETAIKKLTENKAFVVYDITVLVSRGDSFFGCPVLAGGVLDGEWCRNAHSTTIFPELKRRYEDIFKETLAKLEDDSREISIEVQVVGYRDKITHKVEALDPNSIKDK